MDGVPVKGWDNVTYVPITQYSKLPALWFMKVIYNSLTYQSQIRQPQTNSIVELTAAKVV